MRSSIPSTAWVVVVTGALAFASARARGLPYTAPAQPVAPTIYAMALRLGQSVDRSTGASRCEVAGVDECAARSPGSSRTGGFEYPSSVAVDRDGRYLYVADLANDRVQKFTTDGSFVLAFDGGRISGPESIAVDPDTGDVYVLESGPAESRLDKYTPTGELIWMVGKGVNRTTGGNYCSEREIERGARCGKGSRRSGAGFEAGALRPAPQSGDLLAAGGPGDLLYVGDGQGVQELDASGRPRGELDLTSLSAAPTSMVTSVALGASGSLWIVYGSSPLEIGEGAASKAVVRHLSAGGGLLSEFSVTPRLAGSRASIDGIAVGPDNRIAAIGFEQNASSYRRFGLVYGAADGRLLGEFSPPQDNDGLTLDRTGWLYVAATDDQQVVAYEPVSASALATSPVPCLPQAASERFAAFQCALDGAVPSEEVL